MKVKKLIWKIFPSYLFLITITILLALALTIQTYKHSFIEQTRQDLEAKTSLIEELSIPYLKKQNISELTNRIKTISTTTKTRYTFLDLNGTIYIDSHVEPKLTENSLNQPEIIQARYYPWGDSIRYSKSLEQKMMFSTKKIFVNGEQYGYIRSSIPINALQKTIITLTTKLILWGLLICVLSGFIGYLISKKITDPINTLIIAAKNYSKGKFNHPLPIQEIKEFKQLSWALRNMANELEEKLFMTSKQFLEKKAIIENMIEGIITIDKQGKVTTINKTAKKLFSVELHDIIGKSINEVTRHTELKTIICKALKSKDPIQDEISLNYPKKKVLQVNAVSINASNKIGLDALIVFHDITTIKKLESMRKNFVANVSHELKTPITMIKGFIETLFDETTIKNKKQRNEFLTIIQDNATRLEAIIEDLLYLSRLEQDNQNRLIETQHCKLNDCVEKAIQSCQKKAITKKININFINNPSYFTRINFSLMEQALINLIDNAIKYSPEKSSITISLSKDAKDYLITIKDEGNGIPEKHIQHLFERFYRIDTARARNSGGTGLGLSIVKHIAQAHRGTVTVKSIKEIGSEFTLHIPITT